MSKIRVLIVDDQKLFVSSLTIVLRGHGKGNIEVVGAAYDGAEAQELVAQTNPDIVLMDVRMPRMDGVKATRLIRERFPAVKIVILTTFDDDDYVFQALQNGAVGYILKNIESEELVTAIKAVHNGQFLVSDAVGRKLINHVDLSEVQRAVSPEWESEVRALLAAFPVLTTREAEVLHLIARNWDNQEISERLYIAGQTVKNYTSRIYAKLGVSDRLHVIQKVAKVMGGAA
ncbi:MAG TPA: response regulator transcription factor [Spirochaetia bacterium]|nr:response regulator transcription factor [Spirochaetia bacterium]